MEERGRDEDGQAGRAGHEPLSHASKFCTLFSGQWVPMKDFKQKRDKNQSCI